MSFFCILWPLSKLLWYCPVCTRTYYYTLKTHEMSFCVILSQSHRKPTTEIQIFASGCVMVLAPNCQLFAHGTDSMKARYKIFVNSSLWHSCFDDPGGGGGLNSIRLNLTSFYCTLTSGILLYYTVNIFKKPFMFTHSVHRNSGLSESEEVANT